MNWRKIRIGDFLHRVRIPVDIEDDQQYNLVTIRMHHKGVALRATKPGKEIGTKRMYAVQPGHFILSGIDARHGAFGIVPSELAGAVVTNDFWYFEVDDKQVDKELFLHLTSTSFFDDLCRIASDGTTNRVRLQADKFFNYEISLPPVEEQRELMAQLKHTNAVVTLVLTETDQQLTHLTQLRQALLREAMQGQFLPQDPTDEPAAVLLQQLQAARITTGKKGKGKAGVLFGEEVEVVGGLFDVPDTWLWCRLNQIANVSSGSTPKPDAFVKAGGIPYLKMYNLVNQKVDFDYRPQFIKEEVHSQLLKRSIARPGDVLMNIVGPPLGKLAIVPDAFPEWNTNQAVVVIDSGQISINRWIYWYLREGSAIATVELKGMAGQDNISVNQTRAFPIPLPPLAEQQRIVAKLEQLLGHCDALEQRIRESRRLAEQLLATALREALAPPPVATPPAAAELELAEANKAPAHRSSRRGTQLALGALLD